MVSTTLMAFYFINYTHSFNELFGNYFWPKQQSLAYTRLSGDERTYYKNISDLYHREHEFKNFLKTIEMMRKSS